MRPIELVKIDAAAVGRAGHFVGGNDGQIEVVVFFLRMQPETLVALAGRAVLVQPNRVDDPADRIQNPLAAHAMHDKHRGTALRGRTFAACPAANTGISLCNDFGHKNLRLCKITMLPWIVAMSMT